MYPSTKQTEQNRMSYIAITATKKIKTGACSYLDTIVIVVTNEKTSLEIMGDLAGLGNKCRRFVTTEQCFIDYSNGKNLKVEYKPGNRAYLIAA